MSIQNPDLCNCGSRVRYEHLVAGVRAGSCNKYQVCIPYEELRKLAEKNIKLQSIYKNGLRRIIDNSGEDWQYKTWAKEALDFGESRYELK